MSSIITMPFLYSERRIFLIVICILFSFGIKAQKPNLSSGKLIIGKDISERLGILDQIGKSYIFKCGKFTVDGKMSGEGIRYTFPEKPSKSEMERLFNLKDPDQNLNFYKANFKEDIAEGNAEIKNGSTYYSGEVKNGKFNGNGSYTNGTNTYVGEFVEGVPHGFGKMTLDKTYSFEGNFYDGYPHGPGHLMESGLLGVYNTIDPERHSYGVIAFGMPIGIVYTDKIKNGKILDSGMKVAGNLVTPEYLKNYVQVDIEEYKKIYTSQDLNYLSDGTAYFGVLDENLKMQGYGFKMSSEGKIENGIFIDDQLNGYGVKMEFINAKKIEGIKSNLAYQSEYGLYLNGVLIEGTKKITYLNFSASFDVFKSFRTNTSASYSPENLITRQGEALVEIWEGKFNEKGLLEGSGFHRYMPNLVLGFNQADTIQTGAFVNSKLHGQGTLKVKDSKFDKTEKGIFENNKFINGETTAFLRSKFSLSDNTVVTIDGLPGVYCQNTGKTYDGRSLGGKWEYSNESAGKFFNYCDRCGGSGTQWLKSQRTISVPDGHVNRSSIVKYGSNTYVKSWKETTYSTKVVEDSMPVSCSKCSGLTRFSKTTDEIKKMYGK